MLFENFTYESKQIAPAAWEIFVIRKEDNHKFGLQIRCNGQPPNEAIFDIWKNNARKFWVELEVLNKENEIKVDKTENIG